MNGGGGMRPYVLYAQFTSLYPSSREMKERNYFRASQPPERERRAQPDELHARVVTDKDGRFRSGERIYEHLRSRPGLGVLHGDQGGDVSGRPVAVPAAELVDAVVVTLEGHQDVTVHGVRHRGQARA